ncbi:Uncharacterized protein SAMN05444411_102428 [Lutibacter oricola]|uniref:Photosynthesis system II assembly factor Ycf48/Hcf136-like domain-containing protein n=1 Tax=Lutibacter oricola TaxID=762486 RepID=A0A1H2XDI5_9FLAO|nr:hypothetical protein [Lutibacter oricola]SDW90319.1 Uncharacterized protein SAMN05444411_102428 [Lutibacter oricola]
MKIKIASLLLFSILISCGKGYKSRESVTVEFEYVKKDSTASYRAIEIANDSTVVYAGSNGSFGVITGGKDLKLATSINTDTLVPNFRALAFHKDAAFAINIGNPAYIYKFINGAIEMTYKEEGEKVFYNSMKFFDELNGIAVGDPTENCLSILITRDGGKNWGKIPCEYLPATAEGEAAFAASNTNISIVGKEAWIATGGKKARVFHTSDMGINWEVFETPIVQGKEATGIYSIHFRNKKNGIIAGGDYTDKFGDSANKAITKDGGKTWNLIAENEAPKYVSCVQFVPKTRGKEIMAVSTNGLFYSNNAGKNWQKISDEAFYSIRFYDKNNAWVAGNGKIAKVKIN